MDIIQETVIYLEFQTEWGKRTTYYSYISDWSTPLNFLRKPITCKIFKRDPKKVFKSQILQFVNFHFTLLVVSLSFFNS